MEINICDLHIVLIVEQNLLARKIGDEGMIPYCNKCNIPLWDTFTTSIIVAVVNEYNEVALLRQNYVSKTKYVCVAGIIKIGDLPRKP